MAGSTTWPHVGMRIEYWSLIMIEMKLALPKRKPHDKMMVALLMMMASLFLTMIKITLLK